MTNQIGFINKISTLRYADPTLEIHFLVDSDEMSEYSYSAHLITKVEIMYWYEDDERIMTDEEQIKESMYDDEADNPISDEELDILVDRRFKKEVKRAIVAYTRAG